jgi:hypothetical protein
VYGKEVTNCRPTRPMMLDTPSYPYLVLSFNFQKIRLQKLLKTIPTRTMDDRSRPMQSSILHLPVFV